MSLVTSGKFWAEVAYRVSGRDCRGTCRDGSLGQWCDRCLLALALEEHERTEDELAMLKRRILEIIRRIDAVLPDDPATARKPDTIQ